MKKLKIYLSKSKMGSMDTLMQVRDVLSQYENVEILEFSGGIYTTETLLKADIILVIPPELPKSFTGNFTIGKGQYCEIDTSLDSDIPIYFVISLCKDQINVVDVSFCALDILDYDWKLKYAEVNYILEDIDNFEKYFEFKKKSIIKKSTNNSSIKLIKPMLALFKTNQK